MTPAAKAWASPASTFPPERRPRLSERHRHVRVSLVRVLQHAAYGMAGVRLGPFGHPQRGIVRVPFGPTANGVSNSHFLHQHDYVGLSDDMDLGIRWTTAFAVNSADGMPWGSGDLIPWGLR